MNSLLIGPQNKTNLLLQLLDQPITLIDTTGDTARAFANRAHISTTLYFDPLDTPHPVGLNVLDTDLDHVQVAEQITDLIFHLFPAGQSTLTRENTYFLLDNAIRLLLVQDGPQTLLSVLKLLSDTAFRKECLSATKIDTVVASNWEAILDLDAKTQNALYFSLRTKLGKVLSDPTVRNIVGQPYDTFGSNVTTIIANLDRSRIGNARARFLGGLLIARSTGHVVITDYGFLACRSRWSKTALRSGLTFWTTCLPHCGNRCWRSTINMSLPPTRKMPRS
jgi:hypothetical protein